MVSKRKIGWQKYEDVLEDQLSSPLLGVLINGMLSNSKSILDDEEDPYTAAEKEKEEEESGSYNPVMNISEDVLTDISMITNFDCWVGHANFDITPSVLETLDRIDGVELLKICSRYRFFIGVGKMFTFKSVRKDLENQLLN